MENKDQSAFPQDGNSTGHPDTQGLTKREYFAGLAMQGMIATALLNLSKEEAIVVAAQAIQFADELLKQLETK